MPFFFFFLNDRILSRKDRARNAFRTQRAERTFKGIWLEMDLSKSKSLSLKEM